MRLFSLLQDTQTAPAHQTATRMIAIETISAADVWYIVGVVFLWPYCLRIHVCWCKRECMHVCSCGVKCVFVCLVCLVCLFVCVLRAQKGEGRGIVPWWSRIELPGVFP